jgi:curved DNA-binding protein CbpA
LSDLVSSSGEITNMTVPRLFQGLLAEKKTGTMVFTRDPVVKKVHVAGGDVFFASSSLSEDRLGEWLHRAGTITRQQCDAAAEVVKRTGNRQGAVLVELGYITPAVLDEGVRYQVRHIVFSVFNWRNGRYWFDDSPAPHFDIGPLVISTGDLIIEGLRGMEWSVIRRSLPPLKTILRPVAHRSLPLQGEELGQDHRTVLTYIDGSTSIEEICSRSGIGDFNTLRAIYALLALHLAETGALEQAGEAKRVRDVVRDAVKVKKTETRGPEIAELLTVTALLEAHNRLAQQDHFEVLGVGHDATAQEIKKAYFTMAKRYHPDRHFGPPLNEMKSELEALFNAVHEAHETLSSPAKRKKYEQELAAGLQQQRVKQGTGSDKEVSSAAAAAHFKEGVKYYTQRNFWDAEESFQWAIRFDPSNAEYIFRQAMALSHMPRRGRDAEEYFAKAITLDPLKMDYYLEFANFYGRLGLKAKAMSLYRNALKRNPRAEKIKEAIKRAGE